MTIQTPQKPFPGYKWRWAVYTPTEGLNKPPVFMGVLRALNKCEGYYPNSREFVNTLQTIQEETNPGVNLVRSNERNIIRNSGQYWKAVGLLQSTNNGILLTDFGRKVAEGKITALEYAITVVKILELPNRLIMGLQEVAQWGTLKIKPLALILEILATLKEQDNTQAFITPYELRSITIPLAGAKAGVDEHAEALLLFRKGSLDISDWPDCCPSSNDKRMAREFLLFLSYYEFCTTQSAGTNDYEKYVLTGIEPQEIMEFERIETAGLTEEKTLEKIRRSQLAVTVERKKIQTTTIARPTQARFRYDVLEAYNSTCLITQTALTAVLEAAHIIPITENGQDFIDNGFCFRTDIHRLFDTGHLRIDISGNIYLSETAGLANNYSFLPTTITIPSFVSKDYIEWRWNYY